MAGGTEDFGRERATNRHDARWFQTLSDLREYKEQYGTFQIVRPDHRSLRYWVNKQRREHGRRERGEPSALTEERFRALERIGFFDWSPKRGRRRKKAGGSVEEGPSRSLGTGGASL